MSLVQYQSELPINWVPARSGALAFGVSGALASTSLAEAPEARGFTVPALKSTRGVDELMRALNDQLLGAKPRKDVNESFNWFPTRPDTSKSEANTLFSALVLRAADEVTSNALSQARGTLGMSEIIELQGDDTSKKMQVGIRQCASVAIVLAGIANPTLASAQVSMQQCTATEQYFPPMYLGAFAGKRSSTAIAGAAPPIENPLVLQILERYAKSTVEQSAVYNALAAIEQASQLVEESGLPVAHRVSVSSDGILTIQWQKVGRGLALLFAGDGIVSVARREPGVYYAENGVDLSINESLPKSVLEAIEQISG